MRRRGTRCARDLVQQAGTVRGEGGVTRTSSAGCPEMFFEVQRLGLDAHATAPQDTAGRFHVLNLVEGEQRDHPRPRRRRGLAGASPWPTPRPWSSPRAVGHYEVTAEAGCPSRARCRAMNTPVIDVGGTHVTAALARHRARDEPSTAPGSARHCGATVTAAEIVAALACAIRPLGDMSAAGPGSLDAWPFRLRHGNRPLPRRRQVRRAQRRRRRLGAAGRRCPRLPPVSPSSTTRRPLPSASGPAARRRVPGVSSASRSGPAWDRRSLTTDR